MASLRIVTWNVQWKAAGSAAGREMQTRIQANDPDIVCVTEAQADFIADGRNVIMSDPDYGYVRVGARRKAILWARAGWRDVDRAGDARMPGGRYVAGTTKTKAGDMRVIAVCIPWPAAHVSSGRRDRTMWEDHLAYLDGLGNVLSKADGPTIVIGDFNQCVPRGKAVPKSAFVALENAVLSRLSIATGGVLEPIGKQAIDHIAHSNELRAVRVNTLSNIGGGNRPLSDHFGVFAELNLNSGQ